MVENGDETPFPTLIFALGALGAKKADATGDSVATSFVPSDSELLALCVDVSRNVFAFFCAYA